MFEVTVGTSKYDKQIKQGLKPITLVCITDGAQMTFFDDGPTRRDKPSNPGLCKLVAAAIKRITVNGKKVPVFYALTEGLEVFDNNSGRHVEIPFYDDKAKAITEGFSRIRSAAAARHRAEFAGELKLQASKKKAGANE